MGGTAIAGLRRPLQPLKCLFWGINARADKVDSAKQPLGLDISGFGNRQQGIDRGLIPTYVKQMSGFAQDGKVSIAA